MPVTPAIWMPSQAAGTIRARYRSREIRKEAKPFPKASSAPEQITLTPDTTKPRLIIRKAAEPSRTVTTSAVNSFIMIPGARRNSSIPAAMITRIITLHIYIIHWQADK